MSFAMFLLLGNLSLVSAEYLQNDEHASSDQMEEVFFRKIHFLLNDPKGMGLSDQQSAKVRQLKLEVKKDLVMRDAEIKAVDLDIEADLWEDAKNTDEVNKLVDKKYELEKARFKTMIGARRKLDDMLTAEQKKVLNNSMEKTEDDESNSQLVPGVTNDI